MQQSLAHNLDEKERTKDVLLEENVNFTSLLLASNVKKGLSESGYKKPSPIQFKAIPLGRCGFDLIVKSKSGTGKTLVFSTIALETVNVAKDYPQVLILVPTREIAVQIQDVLQNIGRFINGLRVESFIGGMPLDDDLKKVKCCHVAVGAPGRVKHLLKLGALSTQSIRLFVLDEADKLMESSFQNDINEIYDSLPQRKQMIAASATYPQELDTFLSNYMLSPTHVTSENETPLLLGLRQFVAVIKPNAINTVQQMKAKNEILLDILSKISFTQCLIFMNYQTRTESVCNFLNQKGWNSTFISAAVEQSERLEAISNLKNFKNRILLSTDLTSRGIDAPNVDLVINYDLPQDAVTYLHRMGRAGRYGSPGICINLALEGAEIQKLQIILGTIGATNLSISKLPPLNGEDLWHLDLKGLEQIWGLVSETSNEGRDEIVKEVLTMKQRKKESEKKKKGSKKKIKVEDNDIDEAVDSENLLNSLLNGVNTYEDDGKKRKRSVIKTEDFGNIQHLQNILESKKEEDVELFETESLLSSLIKSPGDNDEDVKKRKRNVVKIEDLCKTENVQSILEIKNDGEIGLSESETLLSSLIKSPPVSDEDSKKRKLNNTPDHQLKNNETFSKNRALLSISKLLYDNNTQLDSDFIEPIDGYLHILKTEENLGESSATKMEKTLLEEGVLEDIFKLGYRSAVEKNVGWLQSLPEDEVQTFQVFCRQEQGILISSESEEDCEMEEYNEVVSTEPQNALEWVPVENSNDSSNNTFAECFEDCSNVLWQNGLTFDTVADFDNWFHQWQEQLQSVRNYVQQNIYVEEMSKYQRQLTNK